MTQSQHTSEIHAEVLAEEWGSTGVVAFVTEEARNPDDPRFVGHVPGSWERVILPSAPAELLRELRNEVGRNRTEKCFVVCPWVPWRDLPEPLQSLGPSSLEELALLTAVDAASPGTIFGGLLSLSSLVGERARDFRRTLLSKAHAELVIFGSQRPVSWGTLLVSVGPQNRSRTRFFDLGRGAAEPAQLLVDFKELCRLERGETKHGYIVDTEIPAESALSFDLRAPSLQRRKSELEHLGRTCRIDELFEVYVGGTRLAKGDTGETEPVALLEARDILQRSLEMSVPRKFAAAPRPERLLRAGDFVMRDIVVSPSLHIAEIPHGFPMMVPGAGVVVLRPHPSTTTEHVRLVGAYLASPLAAHVARASAISTSLVPRLSVSFIRTMLVPVPDEDVLAALRDLDSAEAHFTKWLHELQAARSSLFESPIRESRSSVLRAGRRLRELATAGNALDDMGTRIRTVFPLPIAFRWRTVDAAIPDAEGYRAVLEAAEVLIVYTAVAAVVSARALNITVPRLGQFREKLETGRGLDLGSWSSLLEEIRENPQLRMRSAETPIPELLDVWKDEDSRAAVQRLRQRRNDLAHMRGPSPLESAGAFHDAKRDLLLLLSSAEFLSDYPLRLIERTRWRVRDQRLEYDYRELRGDHGLVPLASSTVGDGQQLEEGSLYLFPRVGPPLRVTPLITRKACKECGVFSTFIIDRYARDDEKPLFKALEHGHSMALPETLDDLKYVGFLSSDATP